MKTLNKLLTTGLIAGGLTLSSGISYAEVPMPDEGSFEHVAMEMYCNEPRIYDKIICDEEKLTSEYNANIDAKANELAFFISLAGFAGIIGITILYSGVRTIWDERDKWDDSDLH